MNQERVWIDEDWKAYLRPTFDGDTSGYIRADLVQAKDAEIARLRAERDAAMAGAVKVKPLVLTRYDIDDGVPQWENDQYQIDYTIRGYRLVAHGKLDPRIFSDDTAAIAAAQSDYKARILSALEPDHAREASDAQMRAEGRVAGLREAAEIARDHTPEKHSGATLASHVTGRAIEDAILARAAEIEGESDE